MQPKSLWKFLFSSFTLHSLFEMCIYFTIPPFALNWVHEELFIGKSLFIHKFSVQRAFAFSFHFLSFPTFVAWCRWASRWKIMKQIEGSNYCLHTYTFTYVRIKICTLKILPTLGWSGITNQNLNNFFKLYFAQDKYDNKFHIIYCIYEVFHTMFKT